MSGDLAGDPMRNGYADDPEASAYELLNTKPYPDATILQTAQVLATLALVREMRALRKEVAKAGNRIPLKGR